MGMTLLPFSALQGTAQTFDSDGRILHQENQVQPQNCLNSSRDSFWGLMWSQTGDTFPLTLSLEAHRNWFCRGCGQELPSWTGIFMGLMRRPNVKLKVARNNELFFMVCPFFCTPPHLYRKVKWYSSEMYQPHICLLYSLAFGEIHLLALLSVTRHCIM